MKQLENICQQLQQYINDNNKNQPNTCDYQLPFQHFQKNQTQISNNCRKYRKQQQHKWTIKHTRGNVSDWWDKKTLEKDIIQKGIGNKTPKYGDLVTIDYVIKTLQGKGIDWTRKPLQFTVGDNNMISGINIMICTMKKGEVAKLYIPAGKAFGWNSHHILNIPPMTDLIVKITLIKFK